MEFEQIKILIEKYFDADTSLEEEKILKDYFNGTEIDSNFEIYAPVFQDNISETLNENFDEKIFGLINKQPDKKIAIKRIFPMWLRVAAVFILFLIGGMFWYNQTKTEKTGTIQTAKIDNEIPAEIKDTYTDPEHARQELEKALALLSSKMNKGNEVTARQVNRLEIMSKVIPEQN